MAKSQKEKETVKKKKKAVARTKKTVASTKKSVPGRTAAAGIIASRQQAFIDADQSELNLEDFADVSQERASIISIVKGLEGQVETAFKLKEVLEAELDTTQNGLAEELDARAQLEVQVKSLEVRAALAEQLREDIVFAEEERNKFSNLLAQIQPQLEEVTAERDSLAEKTASAETNVEELEGEKMTLEARVMDLKDRIVGTNHLRGELAEITEAHRGSREQVYDLTKRLEASDASREALERELAETHQNALTLREKVTCADDLIADLRIQLEDQQATNRELMETNTRLENEIKMVNINYKATMNELDASKNALREIHSEATQTSGRVRQRYFKSASAKA